MTKTIQVDDDVYDRLKQLADPFEDTPNSVIRRLLQSHESTKQPEAQAPQIPTEKRLKIGGLTTQKEYEEYLLSILWYVFNGSGPKTAVIREILSAMQEGYILGEPDFEKVSTGETRAENTLAWGRNRLREEGLIKSDSPRGTWELTEEGIRQAKKIGRLTGYVNSRREAVLAAYNHTKR